MIWLIWRQHRGQFGIAAIGLVALSIVLVVSGLHIASVYHAALASCAQTNSCNNLGPQVFAGDGFFFDLVNLTLAVPLLVGMFWGAPLVAREVEQGTNRLVWTQTVTRTRWLFAKLGCVFGVAIIWGGLLSLIVTWWSGPENAIDYTRFTPGQFDLQGIVPLAYSLFAVSVGIAAGSLIRRTIPAVAVTVGVFVGIRLLVTDFVRQHFIPPVTKAFPVGSHLDLVRQNVWTLSAHTIVRAGHVLSHPQLPHACRGLQGTARYACISGSGLRQLITYQPGSRYWLFQGIETSIFLLCSTILVIISVHWVVRHDA